jgi:ribosomal protein S18 acetylase RimI-like enzyme
MGFTTATDRPSPLSSQIEAKTRDLDWTLAHYSFVANVTTLASECDIAHSPLMSVASCRSLPRRGLAFIGDSSNLLATYATFLADPGSEVTLTVCEEQLPVCEKAFDVKSVTLKWQMVFRGDSNALDAGAATALVDNDLPAIQSLARAEGVPQELLPEDPLSRGPAYGIWDRRRLVAMGLTGVCLPGAAQIDHVITRHDYRHQGYGSAAVSALVLAHLAEGRQAFAVIDRDNQAARALFDKLDFAAERMMYAMECIIKPV